tara:strand:+ start:267 stop:479 length:213 start_codon:yes stop_codon:yes gene_type:complete
VKHVAMLATEIAIVRSVQMTSVSDVPAKTVEINHYVEKIKEHEARRASFNERMKYWKNYYDNMDKSQTVD